MALKHKVKFGNISSVIFVLCAIGIGILGNGVDGKVANNLLNFEKVGESKEKVASNFYDYYYDDSVGDVIDLDAYELYEDSHYLTGAEISYANNGHQQSLDPMCPDIPSNIADVLCQADTCKEDKNCEQLQHSSKKRCCFNGCVFTCLSKVKDLPKTFDWSESTEYVKEKDTQIHNGRNSPKSFSVNQAENKDKIAIPGGCLITVQQFYDLKIFWKLQHVTNCTCQDEEIVCSVNFAKF